MKNKLFLGILGLLLLAITVSAAGDLNIISVNSPVGNPGVSVMVDLVLENAGSETINTVLLQSSALIYGNYEIPAPVTGAVLNLGAGEQETKVFGVTLPYLPAGTYTGTVTATDASESENTDTMGYSVTINAVTNIDIVEDDVKIDLQEGQSGSSTFTIKNKGSMDITALAYAHDLILEDGDGDKITLTFGEFGTIIPGGSEIITISVEAEDGVDFGDYSGDVTISANNGASMDSFTLTIKILPDLCKDGVIGTDLEISIDEPDDGDEYGPGEEIDLEINVENNGDDDYDVGVEAWLYSKDDDLDHVKADAKNIDEDEDDDFELTLEISSDPDDIEDGDVLTIFVTAYDDDNEDELCIMESIEVEIALEDEDVRIEKASFSPSTAKAGELVDAVVEVINVGSDEDEDVYIEVKNSALGINERTETFELKEFDDEDDNSKIKRVNFKIPDNAETGTYSFVITVYYAGGDSRSKSVDLVVEGKSTPTPTPTPASTVIVTTDSSYSAEAGESVTIPVTIKNRGDDAITPEISVKGIGLWADLFGIDQLTVLQPDEQSVAYVYLTVKEGISGSQSLTIEVKEGNDVLSTKQVSVQVGEATAEKGPSFTGRVTSFFEDSGKSGVFWIIGDIVLIVIALFFLKMLFTSRKKKQQ